MNYRPNVVHYLQGVAHRLMNIDIDHPPCVPNVYVAPEVDYLFPAMCAYTAMELQNTCGNNPARCYAYNVFAENNFNNAAFADLMVFIAGKIALDSLDMRQNPENIAQETISICLQMAVGAIVIYDWGPEMEEVFDPTMETTIRAAYHEYDRLKPMIDDFLQQYQAGSQGRGMGRREMGGGRGMGNAFYESRTRGPQPGSMGGGRYAGGPRSTASGGMTRQQSPRGTGRFGNPVAQQRQQPTGGRSFGNRRNTEFESQPVPAEDVLRQPQQLQRGFRTRPGQRVEDVAPQPQEEVVVQQTEQKLVWKSSLAQPYLLAYNPTTHYQQLRKTDTGDVIQQIFKKEEGSVDYDRHAIPGYLGVVPKNQDTSKAAERTMRILEAANALVESDVLESDLAQQEAPSFKTVVQNSTIVELSSDAAWFEGNLGRHRFSNDGTVPDVYCVTAIVVDPIIGDRSYAGYVKALGACENYDELCEKINESYRACGPEFFAVVDGKMTALINRQLAQNLSLRARITSFAADWPETRDSLAKITERGTIALLGNEKRVIAAAFSELEEPYLDALQQRVMGILNFPEGKEPSVTFVPSRRTLTYLNIESGQLEIELAKGMPTLLTEDNSPIMFNAVQAILETTEQVHRKECHYIRTNDCRIYEVTNGYLVAKSYLITLVK